MSALPRTGLRFAVVLMAFSWGLAVSGLAAPVPPPAALPKPLPDPVVEAWQKAGAEVGWMCVDGTGRPQFRVGNTGQAGEIPAFRFPKWQDPWGAFGNGGGALGNPGVGGGAFGMNGGPSPPDRVAAQPPGAR